MYPNELKEEISNLVKFSVVAEDMGTALYENDSNQIRLLLEEYINTIEANLAYREIIDDGDRLLWNSIVNAWKTAMKVYSKFMIEYEVLEKRLDHEDSSI